MLDTPPNNDTSTCMGSLTTQYPEQEPELIIGHDRCCSGFIRGCRIAGMIWPCLVLGAFVVLQSLASDGQKSNLISGLLTVTTYGLLFSAVGYFVFSWVAGRTANLFKFFNHYPTSLGRSLMTATLAGGIVGLVGSFIAACLMDVTFIFLAFPNYWLQVCCVLLGTITVMCQVGGALGSWQALSKEIAKGQKMILL